MLRRRWGLLARGDLMGRRDRDPGPRPLRRWQRFYPISAPSDAPAWPPVWADLEVLRPRGPLLLYQGDNLLEMGQKGHFGRREHGDDRPASRRSSRTPGSSRRQPLSGWTKRTSGTPPRRRGGRRSAPPTPSCWRGPARSRRPGQPSGCSLPWTVMSAGPNSCSAIMSAMAICTWSAATLACATPREDTERRIRETSDYIEDAARLARAEPALTKMRRSVVLPMSTPSRSLSNSLRWEWLAPWYLVRAR